jgi:uncharacterized protein
VDRPDRSRWRLLACVSLAVVACVGTSRPSRFFTLAPAEVRDAPAVAGNGVPLAIGPVDIPDYLDRQQIVTRSGENELVVSDFDRWGGSLERDISSSLVATAAERLAPRGILVFPWRSIPPSSATAAYRASITISRFDGALGRSVVLRGRWQLVRERDGREEFLAMKEAAITEQVDGSDYVALVAAMQRALVRFGVEVANGISAAAQTAKAQAP